MQGAVLTDRSWRATSRTLSLWLSLVSACLTRLFDPFRSGSNPYGSPWRHAAAVRPLARASTLALVVGASQPGRAGSDRHCTGSQRGSHGDARGRRLRAVARRGAMGHCPIREQPRTTRLHPLAPAGDRRAAGRPRRIDRRLGALQLAGRRAEYDPEPCGSPPARATRWRIWLLPTEGGRKSGAHRFVCARARASTTERSPHRSTLPPPDSWTSTLLMARRPPIGEPTRT